MVLFTCFDLDFHYRPWKFSTGKPYPKIWKNYRPALLISLNTDDRDDNGEELNEKNHNDNS